MVMPANIKIIETTDTAIAIFPVLLKCAIFKKNKFHLLTTCPISSKLQLTLKIIIVGCNIPFVVSAVLQSVSPF